MIRVSDLFHIVYKGNPKARFEETLDVLLWDLKCIMPSSFKVIARNHSHIIRSSRSEVVVTKSTTANDLKVTRVGACVGSQSHKSGCLCGANPRENESMDSELVRGCISKLLLEVAIDLELNIL